ncbi:hypothetical protein RB195_018427 [Necator americanus]|uniref:Uncharacterized protein n=1 Tax=Necator americanus TaxID=51031 RepID=A0ABR1CBG7_NECAM
MQIFPSGSNHFNSSEPFQFGKDSRRRTTTQKNKKEINEDATPRNESGCRARYAIFQGPTLCNITTWIFQLSPESTKQLLNTSSDEWPVPWICELSHFLIFYCMYGIMRGETLIKYHYLEDGTFLYCGFKDADQPHRNYKVVLTACRTSSRLYEEDEEFQHHQEVPVSGNSRADRETIKEDLKEKRAEVLAEAAEA